MESITQALSPVILLRATQVQMREANYSPAVGLLGESLTFLRLHILVHKIEMMII